MINTRTGEKIEASNISLAEMILKDETYIPREEDAEIEVQFATAIKIGKAPMPCTKCHIEFKVICSSDEVFCLAYQQYLEGKYSVERHHHLISAFKTTAKGMVFDTHSVARKEDN